MKYDHVKIESKWQKRWLEERVYEPDLDGAKKPFFNLMMFPYPSAEGLHVGNMYAFTGADIYGRYQRMRGNDVFEPIGLDGFGIHSENYAMKIGAHPADQAKISAKRFYEQLRKIGNGFAWEERLQTYDPEYYRWTQWLFVQMWKHGLAYRKKQAVNWCPKDKTVLADEQVEGGKCERCGAIVEKRELEQWFFRITSYVDKLVGNIEKLDWSPKVKTAQINWIGLSEGAEVDFKIQNSETSVRIFTTRPDTLFGATYLVVAPEHPLIEHLRLNIQNIEEVKKYIDEARQKTERMRMEDVREKTGVALQGIVAVNPVNQKEIPVWVADYVLGGYGTGAIMAVPAHDERDFEFAQKFELPVVSVIEPDAAAGSIIVEIDDFDDSPAATALREIGSSHEHSTPSVRVYVIPKNRAEEIISILQKGSIGNESEYASIREGKGFILEKGAGLNFISVYSGDGAHVNSDFLNGLRNEEAIESMIAWLEKNHAGFRRKTYRLRDWSIARQRYWGPPVPMIYCDACAQAGKGDNPSSSQTRRLPSERGGDMPGWYAVPEDQLPVLLPYIKDFQPKGGGSSPLASDKEFYEVKCPGCAGDARRETDIIDNFVDSSWYYLRYLDPRNEKSALNNARAKKWLPVKMCIGGAEHSVLHLLYVRFVAMALHEWGFVEFEEPFKKFRAHGMIIKDGAKMSKSKGNVVNPDEYIVNFGADTLRTYLMFMAPFEDGGDFRDQAVLGIERFLERVWKFSSGEWRAESGKENVLIHKTIKKVGEDIANLHYNTAISALMICLRGMEENGATKEDFEMFVKLLAPFAPHMTEEIWRETLGHQTSIHREPWPEFDSSIIKEDTITLVLQVNGRTRDTVIAPAGIAEADAAALALASEKIKAHVAGATPKKIIFVPGRLVNLVI